MRIRTIFKKQQNYKPWKEQKYFNYKIFFCKYVIKEKKYI